MLPKSFFEQGTLLVAKNLLGKTLVRKYRGKCIRAVIAETEAYFGFYDKASHAAHGRTKRTDIMFREAGHIYVYLIYGMHYCLNIVTEQKDFPSAVLIRGIKTPTGSHIKGPGKVTKYFHIDTSLNCKMLGRISGLWIENGKPRPKIKIASGPRIGVYYAGAWAKKPWRFYLESH